VLLRQIALHAAKAADQPQFRGECRGRGFMLPGRLFDRCLDCIRLCQAVALAMRHEQGAGAVVEPDRDRAHEHLLRPSLYYKKQYTCAQVCA
jgi:hypothetical protein